MRMAFCIASMKKSEQQGAVPKRARQSDGIELASYPSLRVLIAGSVPAGSRERSCR